MPHGWAFMAAIIVLEITLVSRLLTDGWWAPKAIWPVIVANAISGAIGFALSLWMNGGWWLVIWMPWVSSNEVDFAEHLGFISIYYVCAFVISVLVELVVERTMLRKQFEPKKVWLACTWSNLASYAFGGAFLYSWSFGLWK
jgi:hypothetical protein